MLKLDQFYTKPYIAKWCWSILQSKLKHLSPKDHSMLYYIEPSAGCCDFFNLLPEGRKTGIDIDTKNRKDLIECDFLTYNHKSLFTRRQDIVVIGNPPFGYKSAMAVRFFNHAAKMANTIAFIVPVQWRKYSVHKQLNNDFQLISQIPLPPGSFYMGGGVKIIESIPSFKFGQD